MDEAEPPVEDRSPIDNTDAAFQEVGTSTSTILRLDGELASSQGFLRVCVLLLLDERPGYGYELWARVAALGFANTTPAKIYRALWRLEEAGLLCKSWDSAGNARPRRVYCLSGAGTHAVEGLAPVLRQRVRELDDRALARFVRDRLRAMGSQQESFEFTVEVRLVVNARDWEAARRKLERCFSRPRQLDVALQVVEAVHPARAVQTGSQLP